MKKFQRKDRASKEVMADVYEYFDNCLTEYQVINVVRKSDYPEDDYLYMVVALNESEKNPTFTVWTCWNEMTKCLNYGHYGIEDPRRVREILDEFYTEDNIGNRLMPMVGDRVEIYLSNDKFMPERGEIVGKDEDGFWDVIIDGDEFPTTIGESDFEIIEY